MRRMPCWHAAIALLAITAFAAPADGHQGDIVFPIYELPTADLMSTTARWKTGRPSSPTPR